LKQRKLRGYVIPTIYVIILMLVFGTVSVISTFMKSKPNYLYSVDINNEESVPVVEVQGNVSEGIIKPYLNEKVSIDKTYYDINDTEEEQANSLIYFENTYMKNTGVLYKSEEAFDCIMVLDGTVLNIKQDEILGNVVEIEHNSNLRTIYYSLDEVNIKVGDFLSQGEVVGLSGKNNISEGNYNLLFEVYYNGALINPEDFYNMDVATLN